MVARPGAGGRHFEDVAGRPNLVARLAAWMESWGMAHLVADMSGVGQGVTSWLTAALGSHRVSGYGCAGTGKKAALGSGFLTLIETGRFKYWVGDDERPLSDGWWFWTQAGACTYDIPPDGNFERDLRWSVPANARVETPAGSELVHDDRLISAALIAEVDRLLHQGAITIGRAETARSYRGRIRRRTWNSSGREWQAGDVVGQCRWGPAVGRCHASSNRCGGGSEPGWFCVGWSRRGSDAGGVRRKGPRWLVPGGEVLSGRPGAASLRFGS